MEIISTPYLSLTDINVTEADLLTDAWGLESMYDGIEELFRNEIYIPDESTVVDLLKRAAINDKKNRG